MECTLINKGAAEVMLDGKPLALPAHLVSRCEAAAVVLGTVTACTRDARGRGLCQTYRAGQNLSAATLSHNGQAGGAWSALADILRGSPSQVNALSRGSTSDLWPLPTGPVVLLAPTLAPDFAGSAALQDAEAVVLHERGPDGPLVATLDHKRNRSLLVKRLRPDTTYFWSVRNSTQALPLSGRFSLLSANDRAGARAEAGRVKRVAPKDPAAQAVMLAGWLQAHECTYEAVELLRGAGFFAD